MRIVDHIYEAQRKIQQLIDAAAKAKMPDLEKSTKIIFNDLEQAVRTQEVDTQTLVVYINKWWLKFTVKITVVVRFKASKFEIELNNVRIY